MDDLDQNGVDDEVNQDEITEEKLINEEYKTWKKNCPFLYDYHLGTALEWPTLTTQWLPDKQAVPDKDYSVHRLLLGTHTSNNKPNHLQFAEVQIPNPVSPDAADYDEEREEIGGFEGGGPNNKNKDKELKFTIKQQIHHPGEVNKARYQPQNPNVVATMCTDGRTLIWDRTKHSSLPNNDKFEPQMELHGHTKEGYGLSWSAHELGRLVTGCADKTVKLWDLQKYSLASNVLQPLHTFTHHTEIVNDVQFHPKLPALIGTVSDDITAQIIDTRQAEKGGAAVKATEGHADAINSLAFNPASEYMLATGSADRTIGIWDVRHLKIKLHALQGHQDAVTTLEWHPHEEPILGSASYDRRIILWDLSRVGDEQTPDDAEDGPPEILFMHGGHTNHISDFSWNKNDPWVVCSAAEDNMVQVWKTASAIIGKEPEDVPINELEA